MKTRPPAELMLLLLLMAANCAPYQGTAVTGDVAADSADGCVVGGCSCSPTNIVCKRGHSLTSIPHLTADSAANITFM